MTTHLEAVRKALTNNTAVAALVSDRIFYGRAKQGTARPFLVLTVVSDVPYNSHSSASERLEQARVQVDSYAVGYLEVHALADAVDAVLVALTGPYLSAFRESRQDVYDDETELHRVTADYMVSR